ncbi:Retinol dehydrogenase 11 [Fasciola hepatica]|uniref:Retinol dehydrogenase 11 n=1 Tax=Fasciola hepatica TaxID=6192 RepID=A0A4E0RBK7_FASHE|nr:Retinol dehydrogenase 11 [Fasciola hepatica]
MSDTKGFMTKRCIISKRLDGKKAIVTGANTGIGFHTAGEMARRGAVVIMACRNKDSAEAAKSKLLNLYGESNADWMKTNVADPCVVGSLKPIQTDQLIIENLDLASLESIRQFAAKVTQEHPKIDFLINNAGLMLDKYSVTKDGFEQTVGVNHLGHFLLTELLLPAIKAAAPSRIIILSSMVHYYAQLYKPDLQMTAENYSQVSAYSSSKLANAMHAAEMGKRLQGTNVIAVSVHPGVVQTELQRDFKSISIRLMYALYKPFSITAWDGAQTTLYTALVDNPTSGGYYSNCALKEPNQLVNNERERQWFWEKSCELVGLTKN